jgi:hypothetical protein
VPDDLQGLAASRCGIEKGRGLFFERHVGAASAPLPPSYRPRQPEKTVLHRVVRENLETMLAEARERSEHGFGYPRFVEKAFRSYIECGCLPRGFVRLKCRNCGYERLLAFSCKSRICPSCHARRMHDVAFHLTDHVLPRVPYRQWVITFPRPIRFLLARDKKLLGEVLGLFMRALFAWQRRAARKDGFARVLPGAITFVQHFGSAVNANLHLHTLAMDGVFVDDGPERELVFLEQMAPSQKEVEALGRTLARRITSLVEAQGRDEVPLEDSLDVALSQALEAPLPRQTCITDETDESSEPPPHRCALIDGYSLHANVALAADDREGLLRLVRYGARQSFSQEHLSLLEDGRIRYALKRPFGPGRAHAIVLEPTALLHRLAALVPRPYLHLTRYHGLFAPNAARRHEVTPASSSRHPKHRARPCVPDSVDEPKVPVVVSGNAPVPRRIPWADLLKRTFGFDLKRCPKCITGTVAVVAYITDPKIVLKILSHLHLPTEVLAPSPARRPHLLDDFAQDDEAGGEVPWEALEAEDDDPRTRAPP